MSARRPSRMATRVRVAAAAFLALAACESYLAAPGEGEPEAPVLENVLLTPATVRAVDAPGDLSTAVEARTRSGIDAVSVVLKSPSGNDRLACDMSAPAQGDAFDGRWSCELTVALGTESGIWVPDSIGLFSSGAEGGVRYFTDDDLTEAGYEVEVEIISEPPVPTELTVDPESAELPDAGSTVTLVATVLDQYGRPIPAAPVVWSSEDPSIAAVSDDGVVTPVSVGATRVVATLDALSDTATVVVPSTPTVLEVTPDPVALDSVGATAQLAAEVRNQFDEVLAGETVTWTSADATVATVSATGLVTAVGGGLTTVQAQAAGLTTDVVVSVTGGTPPPGFTWTNLSGGSWHDAANWDRGAVPGPADTAFVRLDGSYTVTVSADASVAVLDVDNASGRPRLEVAAGTFTVADSAWFGPGSTVALSAGRWDGGGDLVVADSMIWTGGFHSGTGVTRVTPTGSMSLTGAGTKTLQGRSLLLEGQGLVDGGSFDLAEAAELTVAAGATLDVGGTSITSSSSGTQVGRVVVNGTLRKPDTLGDSSFGVRLVNDGLVSIGFGRLLVTTGEGRFEGSGEWWLQADATLRTTTTGEIGAGGLVRGAGTWENRGGGTILGSVDMDGGIVFGNPETILRVSTSDTVRVNRLQVTDGGMLNLDPAATVRVRSDFQFGPGPGIVMGGGSLHLPVGTQGRVNPTSGFSVVLGAGTRFDVGGLLLWEEGGFGLEQGAVIQIASGGDLALEADAVLTATGGTLGDPIIINEGDISREQGTGTGVVQVDVINRGRITARTGTLDLDGGLTHESGALLRGIGTLDLSDTDPVSFQGDLGPGLDFGGAAGALTVQGSLALTGTSTFILELGGTSGGTDADLVDVSGTFTASGTLDVSGLGSYQPAAGDTIEVLRYGSRAGGFDAVVGLDFAVAGGGEPLDTVFEANRLILVGPVNVAPTASISAPADGSIFSPGEAVTFQGSATDAEDGALTGTSLVWSSSIDGGIGSGESLIVSDLSQGDHVITLTATDSQGASGSDEINVTVAARADLSVAMTVTPDSLAVGDTLTHTVTVTNGGPDAVNDVELSLLVEGDVLFAFVEEEGCGNFTTTDPPEKLFQCQLGSLAAGTETTLTLRVLPQAAETLTSTADISGFTGAIDPDAADRSVSDVTEVTAGAFVPPRTGLLSLLSERDFTSRPEVYVQDLDAGTFTRITTNSINEFSPALSPAGTRIAYFSEESGAFDPAPIIIANADGSGVITQVDLTARVVRKFSWSPDGTELAFVDNIGGDVQIWIADAGDPTVRRQLPLTAVAPLDPAWSPDGTRIAYIESSSELVSANASDGSSPRTLLPDPTGSSRLSHPVYSPDGSEIALTVDGAIWVVDVATGASRVVVEALSGARDLQGNPAWSPDGQTLLFFRVVDGNSDGIWAVPADGSLDPVSYYDGFGAENLGNWISR